jgi:hypothetical protein
MASLVGTTIARNYEKAVETSKMGTRELAFYVIYGVDNVETDYTLPGSVFQKAVQGVQQVAEMYAVFPPSSGNFVVMVAADTLPDHAEPSGESLALRTAVRAATGDSNARAYVWTITGDSTTYD